MSNETIWLSVIFFLVAMLYAAVGQAGASGYLAAMGLFQFAPEAMKTTALALNLLVASIGTIQFWRMGLLSWRTFYPFGVLGIPFSLAGGAIQLPSHVYYPVIGIILLLSAIQMLRSVRKQAAAAASIPAHPPFFPALLAGAAVGFVSGITGTGGGIFLSPIILAMNWVSIRQTAAVTAAYNLLNSAAALLGAHAILGAVPPDLPVWLIAVGAGGAIGAFFGSRHLSEHALRILLAFILLAAGLKLILS